MSIGSMDESHLVYNFRGSYANVSSCCFEEGAIFVNYRFICKVGNGVL